MNEITAEVRSGSREMSAGNGMVLDEMTRLQDAALEIKNNIDEMTAGIRDVSDGSAKVSEVAESTREQDVTGQVVDLQARIDNLEASEASYRELVARAERFRQQLVVLVGGIDHCPAAGATDRQDILRARLHRRTATRAAEDLRFDGRRRDRHTVAQVVHLQ